MAVAVSPPATQVSRVVDTGAKHESASEAACSARLQVGVGCIDCSTPVCFIPACAKFLLAGMSWSGFRPSDDATKYGYNIPGNMYAVAALERVVQLNPDVWRDADFERTASHLIAAMRCVCFQAMSMSNSPGRLFVCVSGAVSGRGSCI